MLSRSFSAAPGTYTITETSASVNGFVFVGALCGPGTPGLSPTVTVIVAPGLPADCLFTDAKRAALTITKNSLGGTGIFSFAANPNGGTTGGGASFSDSTTAPNRDRTEERRVGEEG